MVSTVSAEVDRLIARLLERGHAWTDLAFTAYRQGKYDLARDCERQAKAALEEAGRYMALTQRKVA